MDVFEITPTTNIADLLAHWPQLAPVFLRHRMSCLGCTMSMFETLEGAIQIYGMDYDAFIAELRGTLDRPQAEERSQPPAVPQNHLQEQTLTLPYTYFTDIAGTVTSIPQDSILSRTVLREGKLKSIVFAFAPGQELSEHTASVPAIIHILEGECDLSVGGDAYDGRPGTWVYMQANLPHSIVARTPVKMLLLMLPPE